MKREPINRSYGRGKIKCNSQGEVEREEGGAAGAIYGTGGDSGD